ncbi:hypothetical protein [Tenacibaculum salmonis]|uniref:hypothetical protein n=1 Tax=Tenacibaculum sp. P3-BQ1 TaxID=3232310 RepID=UPI0034DFC6BA
MNKPDYFWKNFRLGTEVQVAGTHIYNAIYFLDKLEYLRNEEDIFEFLYNVSVGIERIQKIAIILLEHNENVDQEKFEKDLITHNHLELLNRIKKEKEINFGKTHKKFLNLTSDFYNSYRYQRFNKSSVYEKNSDKHKFLEFIITELKLEVNKDYEYIENTKQVKKFLGKCVSKIVCDFYTIVRERAFEIGTFTYEIRYESKAFKIFTAKQYTFENENNLKREIIISLINEKGLKDDFTDYIKSITPLNFENHNSSYYIKHLFNDINDFSAINDYEYLIDDKQIPKERNELIKEIGNSHHLQSDFPESNFLEDILDEEE